MRKLLPTQRRLVFWSKFLSLFTYLLISMSGHAFAMACTCRLEDNLGESVLSSHHVSTRDRTQTVNLGSKPLYLYTTLSSPGFIFKDHISLSSLPNKGVVLNPLVEKKKAWIASTLDLFSSPYHLLKIKSSLLFCPRPHLTHNWTGN